MRTGPFSDSRVIEKLNSHFVPVLAVNEDYRGKGTASAAERGEYQRIYHAALKGKFSAGTVHVYLIDSDGSILGTLHVAVAARVPKLLALLDDVIARKKLKPAKPVVPPTPLSVAPACPEGGLVLHLTARPLRGGGSWSGVSENWVVYDSAETGKLLPGKDARPGQRYKPDSALLARLLTHFYPVTENNDPAKNKIEEQKVIGKVLSIKAGVVRVRLDGRLGMKHSFYHREDGNKVEADFSGYLDFDQTTREVRVVRLATTEARYGGGRFAVAVRSVPCCKPGRPSALEESD
jgi:hypothetical protein